jgi:large subunit ribosomal protein L22
VDVDNLYVKSAIANDGPRMKRIRPAPMGRAYRYQRRLTHIILSVAERDGGHSHLVTKADEPATAAKSAKKTAAKKAAPKKTAAKKPVAATKKKAKK